MKNKYEKVKKIVHMLYENTKKSIDLMIDNISKDNVRNTITLLNKFNLLSGINPKGYNSLSERFIDKKFFYNKKHNISLISSLIYSEDIETENILEYTFIDVPQSISSAIFNKYSRVIDEKFIHLFDSEKYKVLSTIVEENNVVNKQIYEIYNDDINKYEKIVPLRIYIFEETWFLCVFCLEKKEIKLVDSLNITSIELINLTFNNYISEKQIDEAFNNILESYEDKELVHIRVTPEIISYLDNFQLISDYTIFEDIIDFKKKRLNFLNNNELIDKIMNKELINKSEINLVTELHKKIEFEYFLPKKYILSVNLSNYRFNIIKNIFPNIEVLENDDILKLKDSKRIL